MGRTHLHTIIQPTESTCGPASIKQTLAIFGKRASLSKLTILCKTTSYGTSTKNMIRALNLLGFSVMTIENASLTHILSSLRYTPLKPKAVIVDYLYDSPKESQNWKQSGHWAVVSTYRARESKIVLFDSNSGKKKSYNWLDFRARWRDFDLKRKQSFIGKKSYTYIKKWQRQMALIVAGDQDHLPNFKLSSVTVSTP